MLLEHNYTETRKFTLTFIIALVSTYIKKIQMKTVYLKTQITSNIYNLVYNKKDYAISFFYSLIMLLGVQNLN